MASVTKFVVFFFGLFLVGEAKDAIELDKCSVKYPIKEDFELLKIAGRWYELARYPNVYENVKTDRCYTYDMMAEDNYLHVLVTFITKNKISEERRTIEGKMTSVPNSPGKVRLTMPTEGLDNIYRIIDAKYDDYLITYRCRIPSIPKSEMLAILTREAQVSDAKKKSLLEKLKSLKVNTDRLEFEFRHDC